LVEEAPRCTGPKAHGRPWQHLKVRFQTEHRFGAPEVAVATLLGDPAFYLGLALPDLGQPEILEERQDRSETVIRLRYEYEGSLDPIAQRLLGAGRLRWIQEVRVDLSATSGSLRFEAENDPRRLHGAAEFVLTATASGSVRRIDGDLVVAVLGIGQMAERRIVPGVLRRLEVEAQAIEVQLRPG
jgi:hypothetical protein